MDEEKISFKIKKRKYEKDSSFKSYYVTGAIGGFRNPYDFRLAFYNVDTTEFNLDMQKLTQSKELSEEEKVKKIQEKGMNHKVLCEIIMTEEVTREIYNFLGKELENLEKMKREKTRLDNE